MVNSNILEEMRERPAACYVLSGEDAFLKAEFVSSVKSLLPPGVADFNYDIFRSGVHSVDDVVARVLSYPVCSAIRVVVLRDCGRLSEAERKKILACVENPPGHTVLLLDFEGGSSGGAFIKNLISTGRELQFRSKKRGEVAAWLRKRAARAGKKLSPDAIRILQEAGGDNLFLLSNEMEKLVLQSGKKKEITSEDAGFSAARAAGHTGFELGSAVSRGDSARALKILSDITGKDASASEMLLGALAWHFRSVWKVRMASEGGTPRGRLASVCGIPPFRVGEFARFGRRYSEADLKGIFTELLETDIRLKTRRFPGLELELLVVRLCALYPA